ncbi:MAG TPA: hypothetical protein DE314_16915 [Sulfitobacter sp.]|nr:hypothetical protein [Sulfitobacter sp.]
MMWQLQLVLYGANIFPSLAQALCVFAQWLATPDGVNIAMACICAFALIGAPVRLVLCATLCVHLALLII